MTYRSDATLARVEQIRAARRVVRRAVAADLPLIDRGLPMSEVIAIGLREEVLDDHARNALKIAERKAEFERRVAAESKRVRAAQTADHNRRMAKLNARATTGRKQPTRGSTNARRSRTGMIEQRDVTVATWTLR